MDGPALPRPAYDLEEAYRRHFGGVWGVLLRLGVEHADLEDAVHDVFLVAHRRRDAFTGESSMRTWLLGICRRVAADHRRRHRRHRRRVDGLRPVVARATEPDDTLLHHDGLRLLQTFLAMLDDPKREIFVMVELEQLSGSEAARVLGLNRNTAAARLRAARRAFAGYAQRLRCPPRRLLTAARRRPHPDPGAQPRVLGLLMLRLGEGAETLAPSAGGGASLSILKAAAVSVAIAAAGLGSIKLAGPLLRPPAPSASAHDDDGEPPSHRAASTASAEVPAAVAPSAAAVVGPPRRPHTARASTPSPRGATPSTPPPARSTSAPTTAREPSVTPGPADVDPLLVHSRALERARVALREGDASQALSLVDAAIDAHPTGALSPELALLRIEALCTQGRRTRAQQEADALRRTHAGSPVADRARCP